MSRPSARLVSGIRSRVSPKHLRYAGVSAVFVPLGFVLLQVLGWALGSYTSASLLSAAILTPPNFLANRNLVWRVTSKDRLRTQVVVFWVGAMLGVSLATTFIFLVDRVFVDRSPLLRAAAALGAQLAGFGLVWVGRFLLLDRWLFKVTHHGEEPDPVELDELHRELPI